MTGCVATLIALECFANLLVVLKWLSFGGIMFQQHPPYLHEACAYSVTPPIYSWLSLLQLEWLTQCYLSLFCNPRPSNPRALPNPWTAHIHLRFSLQEVPRNPDLVSGNHHNIETHFATALADASAHSAVATVLALAAGAQIELHSSSQGVRTLGHQRPHCSIFICATIS